jgi:hypothetical protein
MGKPSLGYVDLEVLLMMGSSHLVPLAVSGCSVFEGNKRMMKTDKEKKTT